MTNICFHIKKSADVAFCRESEAHFLLCRFLMSTPLMAILSLQKESLQLVFSMVLSLKIFIHNKLDQITNPHSC